MRLASLLAVLYLAEVASFSEYVRIRASPLRPASSLFSHRSSLRPTNTHVSSPQFSFSLLSLPNVEDEDEASKFERLDEMETLADETNNFPRLVIVFDPPNPSTTLSRIDAVLPATLNLENVFVVRTATPESPNLTVGELLNRIRTYITAVPPPSRVIPSISSLPMPASQPPVTPQTPIVFLSQFSPPEVQQVISACRSLNEDFAFALEVQPALGKSVARLVEEIRGDHENAKNSAQSSFQISSQNPDDAPRDYDIAIGVVVSIAGFAGAYGWETFRLWKEGAVYLPWMNN
ncbi:hypothetical protein TrST_g8080 [Triparma strigata]|uniref:Uncharacterized protein n=1 Tax=Triparma strigata TaxID=1606541 RepID=A0A9W7DX01_9STRA|nr:hypothetical protein TrST_g8080 [Triparma strigata]